MAASSSQNISWGPFLGTMSSKKAIYTKSVPNDNVFLVDFYQGLLWTLPKLYDTSGCSRWGVLQGCRCYNRIQWNLNTCFDPSREMLKMPKFQFFNFSFSGENYCSIDHVLAKYGPKNSFYIFRAIYWLIFGYFSLFFTIFDNFSYFIFVLELCKIWPRNGLKHEKIKQFFVFCLQKCQIVVFFGVFCMFFKIIYRIPTEFLELLYFLDNISFYHKIDVLH